MEINASLYARRRRANWIGLTLSMSAMALGLFVLLWILWVLFSNGIAGLDSNIFTADTPAPGSEGGGLRNALLGSLMIVGLSVLVSTPVGVLAGVYLAEYGDTSKTAEVTRFVTDIMLSAPSIVLGLFVYAIAVATVGNFSGYAGSLALSLIAIPVVVRTTENMLRLVPGSLREAAFALGAPRWKVSTMVTLRAAKSGVITGIRPEHLDITSEGWGLKVETVEMLGAERLVYGRWAHSPADEVVIVRIEESTAPPAVGTTIHVTPRADRLHQFDTGTGKRL